ncbi:hypothetical protein ACFPIJ_40760 [Dactylosporangium cerinum]|uniref:Transposase n=1 Tax=Dactylosporangium cerinum TaxID=1434730 RepID=A0ABV9W840_9ACTN
MRYDLTRITYLAADRGVQVLGRVRSDQVFYAPAPKRLRDGRPGRPRIHGNRFELSGPRPLPPAQERLAAENPRYGAVVVSAWHGLHQRLSKQSGWAGFVGPVPVVPGTVIRIQVERLPGDQAAQDMWLWHTAPVGTVFDLDLLWKTYLRRFDLEHTFRFLKQVLGWTTPQIRTPQQGERWTWLILAVHAQLRIARTLTVDLRRRWETSATARPSMTPGRVRRGFVFCAGNWGPRPEHRNTPPPVQAVRAARPDLPEPATTSARPSPQRTLTNRRNRRSKDKTQAKSACAFPTTSSAARVLARSARTRSFSARNRSASRSAWLRVGLRGLSATAPRAPASRAAATR